MAGLVDQRGGGRRCDMWWLCFVEKVPLLGGFITVSGCWCWDNLTDWWQQSTYHPTTDYLSSASAPVRDFCEKPRRFSVHRKIVNCIIDFICSGNFVSTFLVAEMFPVANSVAHSFTHLRDLYQIYAMFVNNIRPVRLPVFVNTFSPVLREENFSEIKVLGSSYKCSFNIKLSSIYVFDILEMHV